MRDLLASAEPFGVGDVENVSPASMLQAVQDQKLDVVITWEPAISCVSPQISRPDGDAPTKRTRDGLAGTVHVSDVDGRAQER